MLGMLEIAFGRHSVAAASRIATELQILLEKLLSRAAKTDVGSAGVENVVSVERLVAIATTTTAGVPELSATATTAPAMAMATAHALHVHSLLCFAVLKPRRSRLRASCRLRGAAVPGSKPPKVCSARPPAMGLADEMTLDGIVRSANRFLLQPQ